MNEYWLIGILANRKISQRNKGQKKLENWLYTGKLVKELVKNMKKMKKIIMREKEF